MTGLDALCAGLSDLGVHHVFGLPGTQNAEFFNTLSEHGIRPILATHELSASFMANGYARASGRPGVLATIPGPGFTYALPGLAEARLDSVPLLHLVGTPAKGPGRFGHQAIDQKSIAGALAKAVVEVGTADAMRRCLHEAHDLALDGEPGPVVVHLEQDALRGVVEKNASPTRPSGGRGAATDEHRWAGDLRKLLAASQRPVLFVGGGALEYASNVVGLADLLSAPTFTTLTARGVIPEDHRCSIPFDPDRGNLEELNALLERSDLVLALGCKLSHNGTAGFRLRLPEDRLVHVNTDATALGSSYRAKLEIQASVEDVLRVLMEGSASAFTTGWPAGELAHLKRSIGLPSSPRMPEPRFADIEGGTPQAFFRALRASLPRDAVVVTDSGLHQVMTRRYYQVLEPRGLITPSDFQSMGFGLPAAIGAALAAPERRVLAVVGDGGFLMSAMDLVCAARERVPVTVVVFNDGYLNLIRLQQVRDDGRGASVRLATPDLEGLAAAMSIHYERLDGSPERILRQTLEARAPTLLEARLGDSGAIRASKALGLAHRVARRTLGEWFLGQLKNARNNLWRR